MTILTLGLTDNPNSGRITLFNQLAGSRQRVSNWADVTVERKEGTPHTVRHVIRLADPPGTYLLTSVSVQVLLDEQIAYCYIASGEVDVPVSVVDAANPGHNLYLTVQLRETGIPCIVTLNMLDITRSQRICIDIDGLTRCLGCPAVPLVSTRADGVDELETAIDSLQPSQTAPAVDHLSAIQVQVGYLLEARALAASAIEPYWLVLQALENDTSNDPALGLPPVILEQVRQGCGEKPGLVIVDAYHRLIGEIYAAVCDHQRAQPHRLIQ